ncbi:tetratricopeptide (TPR) repeat protein [Catenulispora sp. GP43]|uniref:tetratricopeptide repeat protein n=1 Tax=Catenulispora sp. GP43 TaxID=3156263 RepID=UPI0035114318
MTPDEMLRLGIEREQQGDLAEAERLYAAAGEAGIADAMNRCGDLMAKRGDDEGAEQWYRRAAATGDAFGAYNLGFMARQRGDDAEAEGWYRKAAAAGDKDAALELAVTLAAQGRPDEAEGRDHAAARGPADVDRRFFWLIPPAVSLSITLFLLPIAIALVFLSDFSNESCGSVADCPKDFASLDHTGWLIDASGIVAIVQWLPAYFLPRVLRLALAAVPPLLAVAAIVNAWNTPIGQ